jgi:hypothetical protein
VGDDLSDPHRGAAGEAQRADGGHFRGGYLMLTDFEHRILVLSISAGNNIDMRCYDYAREDLDKIIEMLDEDYEDPSEDLASQRQISQEQDGIYSGEESTNEPR